MSLSRKNPDNSHPEISDAEWQARQELAACYRLFVKFGWTDSIFTHLSSRVPGRADHYLINPFGLLFQEITASNLIKVDFDGKLVSGDYPYNDAGHAIHSSVLKARSDINFVLHSVAYHDYGLADESNPDECERLGRDLTDKYLMIMHNHGLLAAGRTIAEAFYYLYTLENACKIQVDLMASGATPLVADAESLAKLAQYGAPSQDGPTRQAIMLWEAECRLLESTDSSWMD